MALKHPNVEGANYRLYREGTVTLRSWCWVDSTTGKPLKLHYKVTICTSRLDSYNFVYDNKSIEKYFIENFAGKTLEASCELIANLALLYFCCNVEACTEIEVSISGNPKLTWLTANINDAKLIREIAEKETRKR